MTDDRTDLADEEPAGTTTDILEEDEAELQEESREDLAFRGAVVGGALGSSAGAAAGALIGPGGALGVNREALGDDLGVEPDDERD